MAELTLAADLQHVRGLALFTAALVLLIVTLNVGHASDTLAYLMAVGILTAQDPWRPQ